jgi:hypothetical protein
VGVAPSDRELSLPNSKFLPSRNAMQRELRATILFFDFLNHVGYRGKTQYFLDAFHPKEDISLGVLAAMAADARFSGLLPKLDIAAIRGNLAQDQLSQENNDLYPHEY